MSDSKRWGRFRPRAVHIFGAGVLVFVTANGLDILLSRRFKTNTLVADTEAEVVNPSEVLDPDADE